MSSFCQVISLRARAAAAQTHATRSAPVPFKRGRAFVHLAPTQHPRQHPAPCPSTAAATMSPSSTTTVAAKAVTTAVDPITIVAGAGVDGNTYAHIRCASYASSRVA